MAMGASTRADDKLHALTTTGSQNRSMARVVWRVSCKKSMNTRPRQRSRPA